jgi:hypothetical protein
LDTNQTSKSSCGTSHPLKKRPELLQSQLSWCR